MELSANQIQEQLHALVNPNAGNQPDGKYIMSTNYVRDVFTGGNYCVYCDDIGKLYRQNYSINGVTVALEGQPAEVVVQYSDLSANTENLEQPATAPQPTTATVRANDHLRAAMLEAAQAGDPERTAAIANLLKKEQPKPMQTDSPDPAPEPTETPPEALWSLVQGLYPDGELEDYQSAPDGGFVVVSVDTDPEGEKGEQPMFWKIPFTMLEDGKYSLGTAEEVQPTADPEPTPPTQVNAKNQVRAKSTDTAEIVGDEPPKEMRLWAYGLVRTTKGDSILTRENADAIVQAWSERGVDLHFDYEHGTFSDSAAAGNPAPAAGWFALEARDDGLWAVNIRWTEKAATLIRDKEYRYYSPAYTVDTATNHIVGVENAALTNLPATKGIDALVKAKAELEATTAKQQLEINRLRREAHFTKAHASITELEQAGIPTAVINRVRPLLEQLDAPVLTLTRNGKSEQTTAAHVLQGALLELAKIGIVPSGEITKARHLQNPADFEKTITQAADEIQKAKPSLRRKDALLEARKQYEHLRES